jgi:hypothetical protein
VRWAVGKTVAPHPQVHKCRNFAWFVASRRCACLHFGCFLAFHLVCCLVNVYMYASAAAVHACSIIVLNHMWTQREYPAGIVKRMLLRGTGKPHGPNASMWQGHLLRLIPHRLCSFNLIIRYKNIHGSPAAPHSTPLLLTTSNLLSPKHGRQLHPWLQAT